MNGIKVADYYRYQLINISNPESRSYIPHRTGGPSPDIVGTGLFGNLDEGTGKCYGILSLRNRKIHWLLPC